MTSDTVLTGWCLSWDRAGVRGAESAGPAPIELVTATASGLDPYLSPAAARVNVLLLNLDLDERFGRPGMPASR